MWDPKEFLRTARGEAPADLLLKGGRVLDVFSGAFVETDVALAGGRIVGYGAAPGTPTVRLDGAWLVPGLIDAHVHIESSQLSPASFAAAVVPHGTTTVVTDPHEIANVLGLEGVRYMLEATAALPLRVLLTAPSCVPASPFETAGAILSEREVSEMLTWERVVGLGELMNFPGAICGDASMWAKLRAARNLPIDGHAPGLSGPGLWAYALAGPTTDHECTELAEVRERLRCGMHVLIREGTTARNLEALLPVLSTATAPWVHFCTDDRHPQTLLEEGHMDDLMRKAFAAGVLPEVALAAATVHAARHYRQWDLGAVAPGYQADLVVLDDLASFRVACVYCAGERVAEGGLYVSPETPRVDPPRGTVHVDLAHLSFEIPAGAGEARVIGVIPGQVLTESLHERPAVEGDAVVSDTGRDILKLAVVERHRGTGNVGLGLVRGFGLKRGALASTVAHDAHHIVVVGACDEAMHQAVAALCELGGGQVVADRNAVIAALPLPIAGLMSDRPLCELARAAAELARAAGALGCRLPDPFMSLSFLALPVIPHLKLTDQGLVDVDAFRPVPLFVG